MSLLRNGEDKYLNKLVNIHVLFLALCSRLQMFARKTNSVMGEASVVISRFLLHGRLRILPALIILEHIF